MLAVGRTLRSCLANAGQCQRHVRTSAATTSVPQVQTILPDKIFRLLPYKEEFVIHSIEVEYRSHDKEVLKSYSTFLETVCKHLDITRGRLEVLPYIRWVQPALRSKFAHKKYKLHYETRTHITKFQILNVTGSTTATFLEYIQRNVPEGVGMRVGFVERQSLPSTINFEAK